jgi:subtilisin family serine protease
MLGWAAHEVVPANLHDRDLVRTCPPAAIAYVPVWPEEGDAVRRRLGLIVAVALTLGAMFAGTSAGARQAPRGPLAAGGAHIPSVHVTKFPWRSGAGEVVPGQVVVTWQAGVPASERRVLTTRLDAVRIAPTPGLGVDVLRVPSSRSTAATIRRLRRSPLVRFAEQNRLATVSSTDPLFDQQWALNNTHQSHGVTDQGGSLTSTTGTSDADVDAPDAWATQTVDAPVTVAVIDTGVDITHPDLADRLWVNADEQIGTGGVDDDANGFIDDIHGYDFKGHDGDPTPVNGIENSHGTHVAGIVAAEQDNSVGISGVCPDCQIMALRIGTAASLTLGNELKAINYAIDNGADVINMSFGSPIWSKSERATIDKAGANGILVVAAAGNASADNDIQLYPNKQVGPVAPFYPASYSLKNVLTVAASNDRDQYGYVSQCRGVAPLWGCAFTSWGHDSVDVAAPGVDILSTMKQGQGESFPDYEYFDGTSMAAPMTAGIAGLVLSENPTYSAIQVKNAIMHSVDHPDSLKLFDAWAGTVGLPKKALTGRFTRTHGRVNALAALTAATTNATPVTDGNVDHARLITTKRTGSVSWPADANDVFRKKLTKGTKYHVVLNGPTGKDLDLWVWRPGTREIFQFTAGCFNGGACPALQAVSGGKTADEAVTFKAPKTGVFYLQVNGWYSGGSYVLTIKKV